jgi:hypothetical protein
MRWIGAALVAGGLLGAFAVGALDRSSTNAGSAAAPAQPFLSIAQSTPVAGGPGDPGARQAETPLTGDTAERVKAAALGAVPGGTVDRAETDADGSPYEAHVTKADGSRVTVKVDKDFKVTSVEEHGGR